MGYHSEDAPFGSPCVSLCREEDPPVHDGDLIWMIGGPQGGGINVSAEVFARAAARAGQHVFANIEYHSNIMGEHSYYKVRLSSDDRHSLLDGVHVLVALDEQSLLG